MAAHSKYDKIINFYHNEWCADNGYPVRLYKPQATSLKPQASSVKRFKRQATSLKL